MDTQVKLTDEQVFGTTKLSDRDLWENALKNPPSWSGFLSSLANVPGRIKEAAFPSNPDPRFSHLSSFDMRELTAEADGNNPLSRLASGGKAAMIEAITPEDSAYGDLIQNQLGDRFIGRTKDANGYEVLSYLDDNGKRKDAYINQPGIDMQDVERTAAQVIPGLLASKIPGLGGAGKTGSTSVLTGAVKAGVGQGAASVAQDVAAKMSGANQDVDLNRALFSAVGGAGGELLSSGGGAVMDFFAKRGLFKNGELTDRGRQLAERYNINPDELSQKYQEQFASDMVTATDKTAAASKATLQNRGFNPTTAQLTKHPDDIRLERDMLAGDFNTRNTDLGEQLKNHLNTQKNEAASKSISSKMEKDFGITDATRTSVGEDVASGVRGKYDVAKAREQAAWDRVDTKDLVPEEIDRQVLNSKFMELKTDNPKVFDKLSKLDPALQPHALAAMKQIDDVIAGTSKTSGSKALGTEGGELIDLETVRRRLGAHRDAAFKNSGADYNAAKDIMDVYNGYLDDMATKANFPAAVELQKARDLSAQLRSTFGTNGKAVDDPGGRFVKNLIDKDQTSPEEIARQLIEGKDAGAAWKKLNTIFDPNAHELKLIKASAFEQIFINPKNGALRSFEDIGKTYVNKTERYGSGYRAMFTDEEQKSIARYVRDVQRLEIPRVEGKIKSAWGQTMENVKKDGMLRYILRKRGQSATFQSKPTESFLWQWSARSNLSAPTFTINQFRNANKLRNIVEGRLKYNKKKVLPTYIAAPIGGMVGSDIEEDRR